MISSGFLKKAAENKGAICSWAGRAVLFGLILAGILLRVSGLGWGIPRAMPGDATPYRTSFQLDEHTYIAGVMSMKPEAWNFDVHDYHWGTLQFYLVGAAIGIARLTGYLPGSWQETYTRWDPLYFPRIYIVGRVVSALAGILSLVVVFRIGRQLKDADTGLMAAAFLAVLPLHVVNSHFLTSDVTMVLFLLISFSCLLSWLKFRHAFVRFVGSAALGVAVSAKYNAAFLIPLWIAAEVAVARDEDQGVYAWLRSCASSCGAMLAGFAVGEPYAFVHLRAFVESVGSMLFPATGAVREAMLPWPRLLFEQIRSVVRFGMQWSLAVPACAALVVCLLRPTRRRLALAGFILLASASLIFAGWPMIRYGLPLMAGGVIAAALGLAEISVLSSWRLPAACVLCLPPLLVSLTQVQILAGEHTANLAGAWVDRNIPVGSRIGQIWPELPPLDRRRYDLVQLHGLFDANARSNTSDRDFLILDNLPIRRFAPDFEDRLTRDYSIVAEFRADSRVGPWVFDEKDAPHDWKYTHPVLRIYQRRYGESARSGQFR